MSSYAKAFLIFTFLLALAVLVFTTVSLTGFDRSLGNATVAVLLATATIGLLFGLAVARASRPVAAAAAPSPTPAPPVQPQAPAVESRDDSERERERERDREREGDRWRDRDERHTEESFVDNGAFILFVQDLVAATSLDRLRLALDRHLSPLLGTRRLWIASHLRGQRQAIVPDSMGSAHAEAMLHDDGQEWTTFTLRVEREIVGVLGVESRGGLKPQVRSLIQRVTPMIAQALETSHTMESLKEASLVDLLTGASTRRDGVTRLRSEIKRAQRADTPMAVLMLDLDRFKSINDRYGHGVGDAVLTAVGRTLQRTLRASDIRARWGGEEFLIVLPDTDLDRAQVVANGLLRNIAAATASTQAGPIGTTASIGLTMARPGESNVEAIIRRADVALYRAKERGRACVQVMLSDRDQAFGNAAASAPATSAAPSGAAANAPDSRLPFPDRRNPQLPDRRRSPQGRRRTDLSSLHDATGLVTGTAPASAPAY